MYNENHCGHLKLKENIAVYRRSGGDQRPLGANRYEFICELENKKSKKRCAFTWNKAIDCPDYIESVKPR